MTVDAPNTMPEKQKEIETSLQSMEKSLQSFKTSIEKDATLSTNKEFVSLLKDIVGQLDGIRQNSQTESLKKIFETKTEVSASMLDTMIQEFISIKLEYTASKSDQLTETTLKKYDNLLQYKSTMDELLTKVTASKTPEIDKSTIASPTPEKTPEAQKEEEKKSLWDKMTASSFGLAYLFGKERMDSFKEWAGETWDDLLDWIGWKKKEKKEDKPPVATTPEVPVATETPSAPEVVDINTALTPEELKMRNEYIKKSVTDTTAVPIPVDYGSHKDVLIQKGSPENISFDTDSQSIVLGGATLKLNFPQFTMKVDSGVPLMGKVEATVTNVHIKNITVSGSDFIVEAQGTGSAMGQEQMKDISTTLSKDKFYALLKPYLDTNTASYESTIDINGEKVPVKIEATGSTQTEVTPESPDFAQYKNTTYSEYSSTDRLHLDNVGKTSQDMYTQASEGLVTDRLPPLLRQYDASILPSLDGKTMAVVAKSFGTVGDIIDDSFLQKIGATTDNILGSIVDFLSKYEDTKLVGWLATLLKKPVTRLQDIIPDGTQQKEKSFRQAIEKALQDNPSIKTDVEQMTKQFSLVRFYFTEKKKLLAEKGVDVSGFSKLSLPQAAILLQEKDILNGDMSTLMKVGLEANKVSVVLTDLIKSTDTDVDLSKERGKIEFDYNTQELKSRSKKTKIEVFDGNKYKIEGLDITFSDLNSVLRLANLSNRFMKQTSIPATLAASVSDNFVYHSRGVKGGGLYLNNRSIFGGILGQTRGLDTDRVLKEGTFEDHISGRSSDMGDVYAKYLSKRLTVVGSPLISAS